MLAGGNHMKTATSFRRSTALMVIIPALLLGACSQQSSTPAPTNSTPTNGTQGSAAFDFSLFVPQGVRNQGVESQFVSSATDHIRVSLVSLPTATRAPEVTYSWTISLQDNICTDSTDPANPGKICHVTLYGSPGDQTLSVENYNASDALLGRTDQLISLLVGKSNEVDLTLTGLAFSGQMSFPSMPDVITNDAQGNVTIDVGGTYPLNSSVFDASKVTILNPGRPVDLIASSNSAFIVSSGATPGVFSLKVPNPIDQDQTTILTQTDSISGKILATLNIVVPAQKMVINKSVSSPAAGDDLFVTASLRSSRNAELHVEGRGIYFASSGGHADNILPSQPTFFTDANGQVTAPLHINSIPTKGAYVTAYQGKVSATTNFDIVAGPPSDKSIVALDKSQLMINGSTTLTVILYDRFGNSISGITPTVSANGIIVRQPLIYGNSFEFPIFANQVGTANINVSAGNVILGQKTLSTKAYPITIVTKRARNGINEGDRYDLQPRADTEFAVSEENYTGEFHIQNSAPNVVFAYVGNGMLSLTPQGAGTANLTVSDDYGQAMHFSTTVTAAVIRIH